MMVFIDSFIDKNTNTAFEARYPLSGRYSLRPSPLGRKNPEKNNNSQGGYKRISSHIDQDSYMAVKSFKQFRLDNHQPLKEVLS